MGNSYRFVFQPEERPAVPARGEASTDLTAFAAGDESAAGARIAEIALQARIGIDPRTGLATDFLNQYNEIAMLLDLAADDADMLAEIEAWVPVSYVAHFEASGFNDRALAIEAYALAPAGIRVRFDAATHELDLILIEGMAFLRQCHLSEAWALIGPAAAALADDARAYLERLDALIHGGSQRPAQSTVDDLFAASRG